MSTSVVSYLIALYNKEKYILDCVDSILSEASTSIEIEICIVDDGSSDNSLSLVTEKYSNIANVKIESFEANKGKNAAYNRAFAMSSGSYICIFGADDVVVPGRTKQLLALSNQEKKSVYGKLLPFTGSIEDISFNIKPPKKIKCDFYKNIIQNMLSGGGGLLKREHAELAFPIPEHLPFEDWWISYHLLKSNLVTTLDRYVTLYRIHDSNDIGSLDGSYRTIKNDYLRHFEYLKEFEKIATSEKELATIQKSKQLRQSFLGNYNKANITNLSLGLTDFKIIVFNLFGARSFYKIKDALISSKKRYG